MTSRKRLRNENDESIIEDDEDLQVEELEPSKKKSLTEVLAENMNGDDVEASNGMEVSEEAVVDDFGLWKALWKPFKELCGWPELMSLRRVCKLFHELIGVDFLQLSHFTAFPSPTMTWEKTLAQSKTLEIFRNSNQTFSSLEPRLWPFWCSQTQSPAELTLSRIEINTLHLSTVTLLPGQALSCFESLRTISVDFFMAFSTFAPAPYLNIDCIIILPPREALIAPFFQRLKQNETLQIEFQPDDTPFVFVSHFATLLTEGFHSLHKLSVYISSWDELNTILEALQHRESQPDFAPLTHLSIGVTPAFELADDQADLFVKLLGAFTQLVELWLDPGMFFYLDMDSLSLGNQLRALQVSFSGEPAMFLCIEGSALEHLRLTTLEGTMITIDPLSTCNLRHLEVSASTQSISLLLTSLVDAPPPHLSTLILDATLSEGMEAPRFEIPNLPSLTRLCATFSATQERMYLELAIYGSSLRTLELDVAHNIMMTRFELDAESVTKLERLWIATPPSPRLSVRCNVVVPYLPATLKSVRLPPHWELISAAEDENGQDEDDENSSVSLRFVERSLAITCFSLPSLHLSPTLQSFSMVLLNRSDSYLHQFATLLPQLPNLQECLIWIGAPESVPPNFTPLPPVHLRSKSLKLLNIKVLPKIYAKPSPPTAATYSSLQQRSPNCASALDPNLTFGAPGYEAPSVGRSHCNIARCGCSGYTRTSNHTASVAPCSTPRCGHTASEHQAASDAHTRWLALSLDCPQLTHLCLAGLHSNHSISEVIRQCPRLSNLQVSLSIALETTTIAHHTLKVLHIARIEKMHTLYLATPNLSRLFTEACVGLTSIIPYPAKNLELVYTPGTNGLTPDTRVLLTRANPNGTTIHPTFPTKTLFPDMIPRP